LVVRRVLELPAMTEHHGIRAYLICILCACYIQSQVSLESRGRGLDEPL
jgi:hypothetical protein